MTVVIKRKVTYRLAEQLRHGEMTPVSIAIRRAEAMVEEMQGELHEAVDAEIDSAERLLGQIRPGEVAQLYECAERLFGISAACKLKVISDASLGLCDLLDWMQDADHWDMAAVHVHVGALRVLRREKSEMACDNVLAGLRKVRRKHFPVAEPEASKPH